MRFPTVTVGVGTDNCQPDPARLAEAPGSRSSDMVTSVERIDQTLSRPSTGRYLIGSATGAHCSGGVS